jgi:hypothetical protein
MNEKHAREARLAGLIAGKLRPDPEGRVHLPRSVKRLWGHLDHRQRGKRAGAWREIIARDLEKRGLQRPPRPRNVLRYEGGEPVLDGRAEFRRLPRGERRRLEKLARRVEAGLA